MGIYGLTSYVIQHQSELLDDCKLHDRPVLVDGNSAASVVYSNLTRSNHAFGGDYDRYARSTCDFVQLLRKCGLTAIFIFDGGYEQRKLRTVLERIRMNIIVCGQYKNKYRESKSFPLMLRDTFRAVLRELQVCVVQCDFEADNELVILSRILGCPLLSYDSDFCLTDSQYIPFTSIDFKAVRLKKKSLCRKYYLPCKMFNLDKFLNRFGGTVDKSMLPLVSCALGNDYIPRNTFKNFLNLKFSASFEERLSKIIQWISNSSSVDDAIDQMAACVENNRSRVRRNIRNFLVDYNRTDSYLLEFIPQEIAEAALCRDLGNSWVSNSELNQTKRYECVQFPIDQSDTEEEACVSCSDDEIIVLKTEEYEIQRSDDDEVDEVDLSNENEKLSKELNGDFDDPPSAGKLLNESKPSEISNCEEICADVDSIVDDSLINANEYSIVDDSLVNTNEYSIVNDSLINVKNFETSANDESKVPLIINREMGRNCKVPEWFLRKYRLGLITPNLMNVINFQRWFIPSQSEDYFSKPSHEISLPILQFVIGVVLDENVAVSKVKCHARSKGIHLGVYDISPVFEVRAQPLPSLFNVTLLPADVRLSLLMDCLNLPPSMNLQIFPREWRLYIMILVYWKNHCQQPAVNDSHIRAVIMCLICLSVIDTKVGFARTASDLKRMKKEKKRSNKLATGKTECPSKLIANPQLDADQTLNSSKVIVDSQRAHQLANTSNGMLLDNHVPENMIQVTDVLLPADSDQISVCKGPLLVDGDDSDGCTINKSLSVAEDCVNDLFKNGGETVQDFLHLIAEEDCYRAAEALLTYHQVNPTLLRNRKDFDLKLIHSFAQLQHCIQSICVLNSVLDFPVVQCQPHLCFSGTFLYNFYSELNRRKLANGYITRTVLTKASSIIALYRYLIISWEAITSKKVTRPKFEVKKKKKKKTGQPVPVVLPDKTIEPELYNDPYNIYSMLPEEE